MKFNQSKLILESEKVESIKDFISTNKGNPIESFEKQRNEYISYLNNISYTEFFAVLYKQYEIKKTLENSLVNFYNKVHKKAGIVTLEEQQYSVKKNLLDNLFKELEIRKITNGLLFKIGLNESQVLNNNKVLIYSDKLKKILSDVNDFKNTYSLETLVKEFELSLESSLKFSDKHKTFDSFDELSRSDFYAVIFENYIEIEEFETYLTKKYKQLSSSKTRENELELEVFIQFSEILQEYNYKLDYLNNI